MGTNESKMNIDVTTWELPEEAIARLGRGIIRDLEPSPDGTLLSSGSFDGTILLWDMKPYLSPIDTVLKLSE
jgi:WD40 repeat protein